MVTAGAPWRLLGKVLPGGGAAQDTPQSERRGRSFSRPAGFSRAQPDAPEGEKSIHGALI